MILSIVTIHRNDLSGLKRTMASCERLYCNEAVEWIVIDGASDQEDFEIHEYETIANVADIFISEPDAGIYDAMNKGLGLCSGEYTIFMNAGDEMMDGIQLEDLIDEKVDVILYSALEGREKASSKLKKARGLNYLWWGMPTHHQAIIIRTLCVEKFSFDVQFKVAADYKNLCELYMSGASSKVIDKVGCYFDTNGMSSNNYGAGLVEQTVIRQEVLLMSKYLNQIIMFFKACAGFLKRSTPAVYGVFRYERS
jgi:putative colanic acid biosynthesis glycosyltransferase